MGMGCVVSRVEEHEDENNNNDNDDGENDDHRETIYMVSFD